MTFLIMSKGGDVPLFPLDTVRAGAHWWSSQGGAVKVLEPDDDEDDLIIDIEPDAGTGFQVRRDSTGRALTTDGTPDQVAVVGAWARSLLPPDEPTEVWLVDWSYTQRVVLTPGMTAEQVRRSWKPIEA